MQVRKISLSIYFSVFLLFAVLALAYVWYLSENFGYLFLWQPIRINLILGFLGLLITMFLVGPRIERPSDCFLLIFYIMFIIPSIVLFAFRGFAISTYGIIISGFIILSLVRNLEFKSLVVPYLSARSFSLSMLFFSISVVMYWLLNTGLTGINFNISEAYVTRASNSAQIAGVLGYIMPTIQKVILPFIMVYGLQVRRLRYIFAVLFMYLILFGIFGTRSSLAFPLFTLGFYWVLTRRNSNASIIILIVGLLSAVLLLASVSSIGNSMASLAIRRAIFMPSLISVCYFEYFSTHEPIFWSLSKLSFGLVEYPYALRPGNLIGESCFGKPEMNANVGLLGSGMMQAGALGVYIYTFAMAGLVMLIDSLTASKNYLPVSAAGAPIFISATNSVDFISLFLTHGMFAFLLIACLYPRNNPR